MRKTANGFGQAINAARCLGERFHQNQVVLCVLLKVTIKTLNNRGVLLFQVGQAAFAVHSELLKKSKTGFIIHV